MTIPFRCAEGTKRHENFFCRYTALVFYVKILLEKQVHYRVRGGEWAQRKLNRIFMCTDCSFKHKYVWQWPRRLIFGETNYSFFSEQSVNACFLKYILRGLYYAQNRFGSPQICQSNSRKENWQERCQMKYTSEINLICSVPGLSTFSAISVTDEIGVDMSVFPFSKNLCSWAGLTPQNDHSAGNKKTTHINRAGVYIKPLLVQCALAAIKSKKKHPEIYNRYAALKKTQGSQKSCHCHCRNAAHCYLQHT